VLVPAAPGVDVDSVRAFVAEQWADAPAAVCLEISGRHVVTRMEVSPASIRPGGFISGPTQFGMADLALIVGSVVIFTDDPEKPTAVCQGTYVLPK